MLVLFQINYIPHRFKTLYAVLLLDNEGVLYYKGFDPLNS